MAKLLMVSGDRALAEGKRGAFYNTLKEFHKYWDRIDIICPNIKYQTSNIKNIFENVFIHPSPWPLIMQPLWILKKGKQIYKEQKFNLMTVHEYPPFYNGIGARLLWGRIRVPYILEIHHIPGFPKAAGFKDFFYKLFFRVFIKADITKAQAVRVVNKIQTPEFLKKSGAADAKIVYVPSMYIDSEIFKPLNLSKKYDLVFAARLEKNKGINLLLQAISNVKTKTPDVKLLIIGGGLLKIKLQNYVKRNDLERNIVFSDWLETAEDVARAYNSAKIFINPSFNEGGPRVALEAMACGLPVITTRVGVMLDIIKDGENGLFTGWEPEGMADKISYLLGNQELRQKFSQAGLKLVHGFEKNAAIKNYAQRLQDFIPPK
jgi:glycosyltransferase involved in cell wall biosynthesis